MDRFAQSRGQFSGHFQILKVKSTRGGDLERPCCYAHEGNVFYFSIVHYFPKKLAWPTYAL